MRRISLHHPQRQEAIKNALVDSGVVECAHCGLEMRRYGRPKEFDVDHIENVSGERLRSEDVVDWNEYIEKLFCGPEGLQVLCKHCHINKTQKDLSNLRRLRRKA